MLKLIGLLCIVMCGAAAGIEASSRLKGRAEYCRKTSMLLRETASIMRFSCEPLPELINELAYRSGFMQLGFIQTVAGCMEEGVFFPDAWQRGIDEDGKITPELRVILEPLGESLGASDIEGQLMTLGRTEEQLQELYRMTQEQYTRKGRLYRCLGILGGMSAALLIC